MKPLKPKLASVADKKTWKPMQLSHAGSLGDLMRNTTGSRRDNNGSGSCAPTNRQAGGSFSACP